MKAISLFLHAVLALLTGIDIPFRATIGKGLHISHFGGIIINPNVVMGEYCNIGPGVVIGQAGRRGQKGSPIIGDFVYIGAGAKLIGNIRVGNNVAIGANAVIVKDVPDNAVVVGVPGRIISFRGSADYITLGENG